MLNCQSFTSPSVCDAARSRSTTASRSAISRRLDLCSLSQPFFRQSSKFDFIANQKQPRALDNARQKVMPFAKFTTKLVDIIDGRVYFPPQLCLSFRERGDNRFK